ncbi:MAG: flippase [Anaerolineae bacterium]
MNNESPTLLRVGKNALARFLAQVWVRLLSMVLVALVARYESAEGLGRYVLVLTIVGFAGALFDLGLTTFLTREVAREGDLDRQRNLLGTVLSLRLVLSIAGTLGLLALATFAPFPAETRRLLPIGALLVLPEAIMGILRALVHARQRMEISGGIDMVVRLVAVAVSFLALRVGFGVLGVLLAAFGASLLGVLMYAVVTWRWRVLRHFPWAPTAWRACLAESYPFALTSIAAVIYTRIDLVLLGLWQGEIVTGWYAAAYKLWEAVGLLPASVLEALFPEMSRLSTRPGGRQGLSRLFRNASWIMVVAGLLLAAAGMLIAPLLMTIVYGSEGNYAPAVLPFRLLICAVPAMFLYLLGGHVLYALGKQRRVTVVMMAVGVVNVVLNVALIPRWSYWAAAAVALLCEWLLAGLLYPQARRALAAREVEPHLHVDLDAHE